VPTSFRYKPSSGFSKGNPKYDDPNDKEPPIWKSILIFILIISLLFGALIGGFLFLDFIFSEKPTP
jgi:hypothetical protein